MRKIMVTKIILFLLTSSVLFCGCKSVFPGLAVPTHEQLLQADYGQYPENIEEIVKEYIRVSFFDPYSVRDLRIEKPKQNWYRPAGYRQQPIYGYETRVYCNAKNRMGAYIGLKKHFCFIRNGRVIAWHDSDDAGFRWLLFDDKFDSTPEKYGQ